MCARTVTTPYHLNGVTSRNSTTMQHHPENALAGEDAIARQMVNGTTGMAHFTDLADFHQHVFSQTELRTQRQIKQIDSLGCKVFGKIARTNL